jgi:hypothetical protein
MRFTASNPRSNPLSNSRGVRAVLLGMALSGVVASGLVGPASAQSSDAGPPPDNEAHTTAATEANPATEPTTNSGFPKTLTPQQRLPENLQGWLRERNRRHPALAERPRTPAPNLAPQVAAEPSQESQTVDGYKRRLRSFDEHGVTVLSNRHATVPAPEPPRQPVAATAAIAVAAAVPAPRAEEDAEPEPPSYTETRSLRAKPKAKAPLPDQDLGWPAFAVPIAAIGLGLIWLRRRRQANQ